MFESALGAHHGIKLLIIDLTISVHVNLIEQKLKTKIF